VILLMSVLVPIGDFSRMTHLSIKALRYYHDQGLLEPAEIDLVTGYRFYDPRQVPVAQVIRRFRDLGMPLEQVKSVLQAPDVEARNKEIAAHLTAMEHKLADMQMSVASLRALLEGSPVRPSVEFRSIPATRALAVRGTVTVEESWAWGAEVFAELYGRIKNAGLSPAGPGGALFPAEFFQLEEAELTAFVPVKSSPRVGGRVQGRVQGVQGFESLTIPGAEAAVMLHAGPIGDADQTYGVLGTVVAERAIGVEGPIREYYLVPFSEPGDPARYRTEICWPVFRTTPTGTEVTAT
jgi:DNA-binding transcriptional MerR regulator